MERVRTTAELTRNALTGNPATQHDVRELLFTVWEGQGFKLTPAQRQRIGSLAQPETIRRTSRKILNEGK